ncbi:GFA family protein [Aquincola sp. S2]|uniref:GFA family protein n=1 Tax=Pseudaquabacterium terrae TaxID=2732868 RepID=A0ABX2EK18_9BURK|nr:GFA family protein [Aquabacterium terrae]NRF68920.1 GFA family protein [Aquabacterium terrae]
MNTRIASCSCGQLQAEVHGEPLRISVCHCLACQKRTGSVFGEQARFDSAGFKATGAATEYVRVGDGGTKFTFRFCPMCGATVYYTAEGRDGVVAVPVGAFADPGFPSPTVSFYERRQHSWLHMPVEFEHNP